MCQPISIMFVLVVKSLKITRHNVSMHLETCTLVNMEKNGDAVKIKELQYVKDEV